MTDTADSKTADQGFSYEETGYMTTASCHKQSSAVFPFEQYYEAERSTQFNLLSANNVTLKSGNVSVPPFDVATAIWNGFNSHAFGYFAWAAVSDNGTNYLATSSNGWSVSLNDILCTIEFVPMLFSTNVSTVDQFITVTPLKTLDNFNQTGNVPEVIMWDLDLISRMSSSSLGYSSLYNAISANSAAVKLNHPEASADEISELSMRDSIVEIADDLLTYQGILAVARADGESVAQPVQRHFAAIKIGQSKFIIAQFVVNIALCVIYLCEAGRTRYWKRLPSFDFVDIKALTLAALGPESSQSRSLVTTSTSTSHPFSRHWAESDDAELTAFYEGKSRPRLRYADPAEERQHHLSDMSISQTTFAD